MKDERACITIREFEGLKPFETLDEQDSKYKTKITKIMK